jgi:hypothetical protein
MHVMYGCTWRVGASRELTRTDAENDGAGCGSEESDNDVVGLPSNTSSNPTGSPLLFSGARSKKSGGFPLQLARHWDEDQVSLFFFTAVCSPAL